MFDNLPDRLSQSLSRAEPRLVTEWEPRPAAVLVPLYLEAGEWHLLFTRRTESLEAHRGQVAFPGGAIESTDPTPEAAALREANEEIGLPRESTTVIGTMNPLMTVTQFVVTPVVGVIEWPMDMRLNPAEVAAAFGIPMNWLADPANLEVRRRQGMIPDQHVDVYYFRPYGGEVVWGVTARITVQLLRLLTPPPT